MPYRSGFSSAPGPANRSKMICPSVSSAWLIFSLNSVLADLCPTARAQSSAVSGAQAVLQRDGAASYESRAGNPVPSNRESRSVYLGIGLFGSLVLTVIRAAGATRPRRVGGQLDGSRRITSGPSVSIERCNPSADLSRVFIGVFRC